MIRNDTHEVRIDRPRGLVVKRFRSARRGEPVRIQRPQGTRQRQADRLLELLS